jgi:predicted PurR-regulated permease PerM
MRRPVPRRSLPIRSAVTGWPIAAVFAVVAILLYEIRYALLPFVAALAIAFIVEPVVRWLQARTGRRRWRAALVVYLAALALIGGGGYWIGSAAATDLFRFVHRLPAIVNALLVRIIGAHGVALFGQVYTPQSIVQQIGNWAKSVLGVGFAAKLAGYGIAAAIGAVLALVLLGYFMFSGPRLTAGAIWLIPPERRAAVERLLPQIIPALRRYLVGVLAVVAYTAFLGWIAFGPVFHLPHATVLALAVGILEIIPVVGPAASMTLVGINALQEHTLEAMLALFGVILFLRLTVDNLVGPIALGQAARLHPVVIIFSFVVGAMLFGVVGVILAVPAAVCLNIVLRHYYAEPIARNGGADASRKVDRL